MSKLRNNELAYIILRELWRSYDSGGVSYGRSFRAHATELYFSLAKPKSHRSRGEQSIDKIYALAKKAKKVEVPEVLKRAPLQFQSLSRKNIARLLISRLWKWYRYNWRLGYDYIPTLDTKRIGLVCRLIGAPTIDAPSIDMRKIIQAGVDIERTIMEAEIEIRYKKMWADDARRDRNERRRARYREAKNRTR